MKTKTIKSKGVKKEFVVGLLIATLILSAGLSSAFAHKGEGGFDKENIPEEVKVQMEERRNEMEAIMESGNYDAWVALVNERHNEKIAKMQTMHQEKLNQITETNFAKLVEAYNLRKAGNHEGAKAIMEELGIEKGANGFANGRGGPKGR